MINQVHSSASPIPLPETGKVVLQQNPLALPAPSDSIRQSNQPPPIEGCVADTKRCIKLMQLPSTAYCYCAPEVHEPPSWAQLSPPEREEKVLECLESYGKARAGLEHSIAVAASSRPEALTFAQNISGRIFDLIKAEATVDFRKKERRNPTPDELTLAVNHKLSKTYGSDQLSAGGVGVNPLAIRKVFREGNLREQMFIPYNSIYGNLDLFKNTEKLKEINECLKEMGTNWSLDLTFIEQMQELTKDKTTREGGFFAHARVAGLSRDEETRESRTPVERARVAQELALPVASFDRTTPLSPREILAQTGEIPSLANRTGLDAEKVKWRSGAAWYRAKTKAEADPNAKTHQYLSGVEILRAPQTASISGTTDTILTLARCLSFSSEKELIDGRLALLGWMVGEKDHSVHEIMTASKAFELPYSARADDYQDIYPGDSAFIEQLTAEQKKQGLALPDTYLSPKS